MPPRAKRRARRGRPRGSQTTRANGTARSLLTQISSLVSENESLTAENRRLQSALSAVSAAVSGVGRASRGRRGRPAGRPAGAASTNGRRRRRRVTNPETLERRRAGLAKARAVLAAKRAAAKRKG